MNLESLLNEVNWDRPFYKQLAHNDTGRAVGHQAGIVIPKILRQYFPGLSIDVEMATSTVDHHIHAELLIGNELVDSVVTRYQYQTWGGTRSPESRITDQLTAIRNSSAEDDLVIFQRALNVVDHYRIILIKKGTPYFDELVSQISGKRWGVIGAELPLRSVELQLAEQQEKEREGQPFSLFDTDRQLTLTKSMCVARSVAFRKRILDLYSGICSFCGQGLRQGSFLEVEAAHIVPRNKNGIDDARNGLSLCRSHHWAFDKGLVGVDSDRKIVVPSNTFLSSANLPLAKIQGANIIEARNTTFIASESALAWHADNILKN